VRVVVVDGGGEGSEGADVFVLAFVEDLQEVEREALGD
jgi:hypothetical protein